MNASVGARLLDILQEHAVLFVGSPVVCIRGTTGSDKKAKSPLTPL
ncbi:MAG: hypothetical protein U0411_01965 [Thermodesulfovibrionales bacterium]